MTKVPSYSNPGSLNHDELDEHSTDPDPYRQFNAWFSHAVDSGVPEPDSMFLASADKNGIPSGRIVLLKGFDSRGFVFYTNYKSRKGSEIQVNPYVAVVFHWKEIDRQVRITGKALKVSAAESDEYFSSRPLESRISAIISPQSSAIPARNYLDEKFEELKRKTGSREPVRPDHWGGFRIIPATFEFWQFRSHRLHDRIQYRQVKKKWIIERLAP